MYVCVCDREREGEHESVCAFFLQLKVKVWLQVSDGVCGESESVSLCRLQECQKNDSKTCVFPVLLLIS